MQDPEWTGQPAPGKLHCKAWGRGMGKKQHNAT